MANLHTLIYEQRKASFVDGAEVSDAEVLGILIANYFKWDGAAILETASSALEDANFHAEAAAVDEMLEAL